MKYSGFKKALFGTNNAGWVFIELDDGMGAEIDIKNRTVELKPFGESRVYCDYDGNFILPNDIEIQLAKEILKNPKNVCRGFLYEDFYNVKSVVHEDIKLDIEKGIRLIA